MNYKIPEKKTELKIDPLMIKWIKLYFREFSTAINGRGALFSGAYFCGLLQYWGDNCKGLPNDLELLRRICQCDPGPDWDRINAILFDREFGNFFHLEDDDRWHQSRALKEWLESADNMADRSKGGKNRWIKHKKHPFSSAQAQL